MKKTLISILTCICITLTCFTLAACRAEEAGASVYFLNFKPESAKIYEKIADDYYNETGVKVKVVTAAANTYEQTLKSEIAKKNAPTIFQINGPIGFNTWKKYCADLKDSKLYSYLTDKNLAIKEGDGVYGIPYVIEAYGIIYNKEITDRYFALKSRQTQINSMDEVTDYNKLRVVVEDMTKHKKELGIDGVFSSTSMLSGEDWRWQTHLMNIPLYYEFIENEKYDDPTVAGLNTADITFKYADKFKNIFDLYINNSTTPKTLLGSKSVADSMAEFALGKAAMVQNGTWGYEQIKGVKGNTVKAENTKFLPIYLGIDGEENQGLCVGTENYLAINKNASAEQQKASLDFLEWLYGSEKGKKYVSEQLGFTTPFNTFSENETPTDPLAKETVKWMNKKGVKTIPWVFTAFPSETFKTELGSLLLGYAQGDVTWDEVKQGAIKHWKSER
ncbi:MAG: ABC transporter substrate-binding protein [Acutalibacteraceae bacterium]|nr:ABC transporter substrate-binding protein [Acutalibacteraceae bacterium]